MRIPAMIDQWINVIVCTNLLFKGEPDVRQKAASDQISLVATQQHGVFISCSLNLHARSASQLILYELHMCF